MFMTAPSQPGSKSHACQCGGDMIYKKGTVKRVIREREIRIHNAPYYQCDRCGEIEFDLSSRISSIAVEAYKNGDADVNYEDKQ